MYKIYHYPAESGWLKTLACICMSPREVIDELPKLTNPEVVVTGAKGSVEVRDGQLVAMYTGAEVAPELAKIAAA